MRGFVYIVGVGPGDPELLTLKAVDRISRSEVIVYGRLVPDEIVRRYARSAREVIKVEKSHRRDAIKIVVEKALEGKIVAHLKNGDPMIFSNIRDEIEELKRHGIPYEIVPGVSSLTAAAASADLALTDFCRGIRGFAVVNGHGEDVSTIRDLVERLGLVAIMMPDLRAISELQGEYNVVAVVNATRPDQRVVRDVNAIDPKRDVVIVYVYRR